MLNHPYVVAAFEGAGAMVGIVLGTKHAIKELLHCAIGSSTKQLNDATPVKSQRDSEWAYVKVVQLRAFSPSKSSTKAPATPEPSTPRPASRAIAVGNAHAHLHAESMLQACSAVVHANYYRRRRQPSSKGGVSAPRHCVRLMHLQAPPLTLLPSCRTPLWSQARGASVTRTQKSEGWATTDSYNTCNDVIWQLCLQRCTIITTVSVMLSLGSGATAGGRPACCQDVRRCDDRFADDTCGYATGEN